MESVKNWTKEEFKAYMLIYASESDHTVSEEEKEMLESRLDQDLLKKIGKQIKMIMIIKDCKRCLLIFKVMIVLKASWMFYLMK